MCFVAVTALTSCSKDIEDLILGKWECTHSARTEASGTVTYDGKKGEIWEFKTNGVLSYDGESTTYTLDGKTIVFMGGLVSGTVSEISSSKLVLDYGASFSDTKYHMEFAKK